MPSMIFDSWTMAVKEWREWRFVRSRFGWGFLVILIMAWSLIAALLLGYFEAGRLITPIVWAALPFVLSTVMITDSIAGGRERQTLRRCWPQGCLTAPLFWARSLLSPCSGGVSCCWRSDPLAFATGMGAGRRVCRWASPGGGRVACKCERPQSCACGAPRAP